jgi:hypothetical protein
MDQIQFLKRAAKVALNLVNVNKRSWLLAMDRNKINYCISAWYSFFVYLCTFIESLV